MDIDKNVREMCILLIVRLRDRTATPLIESMIQKYDAVMRGGGTFSEQSPRAKSSERHEVWTIDYWQSGASTL